MSQPVKLSDALVLDARTTGEIVERSIAGQIEHWANIGRAVEKLLHLPEVLGLCRSASARPLSALLESVDSREGKLRVSDYLDAQPFPHYEAAPDHPGLLVRTEEGGKRTLGRFVNRKFLAVKPKPARR
jgi:hypothetical protein